MINNAGQAAAGSVIGLRDDYYRRIIDLNIFGPICTMRAVVPIMRRQGGGIIVNVSSTVAYLNLPSSGHFASTKAALDVLSRTARLELERDNIRVITLYPNLTATNLNKNALGEEDRSAATPKLRADRPEKAAEKILEGVREERREKFADRPLRLVVTAAKLAPGLVERVILKRAQRPAAPTA